MSRMLALVLLVALGSAEAGAQVLHRVFLIGDTGGFDPAKEEPVLETLRSELLLRGDSATVVFLGDNIYGAGLADSLAPGRALAQARLVQQLETVAGTGARVVFIPGNHDWDHSGPAGLAAVRRQERFVEAFLDQGNTFLPDGGLPGPELVPLADGVDLIVLDTEWMLRRGEKAFGDAGRYETREEGDVLANLADVLRRRDDNRLLVVGHHPILSNGHHGGRYSLREHLFPLTELWDNAWVPLPFVGSLYPLVRSWSGGPQDLSHPRYRSMRSGLLRVLQRHEEHVIYASGHDHSLQHFPAENIDFLVSGSASRPQYVSVGRGATFASPEAGFLEVIYSADGSSTLVAHTPGGIIHNEELRPPLPDDTDLPRTEDEYIPPTDTVHIGAAGPGLEAGPVKRFFLGAAHRDAWTSEVAMPVLNVGTLHGGLRPIRRGGGQQTVSIRLENPDGREFVLRSLAKDPTKTLPEELRETIARDIVLDQVSILHPYAALLVPPLAQASGIYYASPEVYFVPDDSRLAPYTGIMAGRMMMLEERPDDDMSHAPNFGSSDEVISTSRMYHEITSDNDHRVDARFFARNRIFDMLISDWDRHEDQWRWASFEPPVEQGKIYRPIPRDRDWAFNRMNGLFPTIVQSRWVMPKFQEFKRGFGFLPGLNNNGLPQDRRLTASLTPDDWAEIADSVATAITDSVIAQAIAQWPEPVQELQGVEFESIFRARRSGLSEAARGYAGYLDRFVDVVMSDKHEEFVVEPAGEGLTRVVVNKTTREGEHRYVLFDRTFSERRTSEIRLYGMGGEDRFEIGETGSGIRIHVIGGRGADSFNGHGSAPRNVFLYDVPDGIEVRDPGSARLRLSTDPLVNRYDRYDFAFNAVLASLHVGGNDDDGVYLGGGPIFYRHAFRKQPFAARHRITAASAARFQAYQVEYEGELIGVGRGLDLVLDARVWSPNNFRNFFGLGNETENTARNREFYQARLSDVRVGVGLRKPLLGSSSVTVEPFVQFLDVRADQDRFVTQAGISPSSFEDQFHTGLRVWLDFDTRDSRVLPHRGLFWRTEASGHLGLNDDSEDYARVASRAATYYTPTSTSPVTVAFRVGVDHAIGAFPFWAASTIGGSANLRGFRKTRFAGRTALFQNLEARLRVSRFAGYLAQGAWGVLGFLDHGRVWTDGESSGRWHRGLGGGAWVSVFGTVVVRGSVGFSEEERHYEVGTGFLF